ncbi:SCO family protein [soil metagenome]
MSRAVATLIAVVAIVVVAASCGGEARELVGYTRTPAPTVDVAELPDVSQGGEPFRFAADTGDLLVVYFGYTNCPDVCPTTMADLRRAIDELDDDRADRIEVAMVTVDPDRDTDVLAEYVQSFVPHAHAIATGDAAALATVAAPFGVSYEVSEQPNGDVDVAHSTQLYVVDDAGSLVLTWPFGTTADDIAGDLKQLLDGIDG